MIHAQYGRFIGNKPWFNPTVESLKKFLECSIDLIENYGYTSYVGGSCAHDISRAHDLDLYLLGEVSSIENLDELMYKLYENASNCYFRLDCKWIETLDAFEKNNLIEGTKIPYKSVSYIEISYAKLYMPERNINSEFFLDHRKNAVKISDWLIKGKFYGMAEPKPVTLEYYKKHGKFPQVPSRDFLKSLG